MANVSRPMSESTKKALNFLKENVGQKFNTKELASALGYEKAIAVTGSVTGLVKKGLVNKIAETTTDANGNEKIIKYYTISQEGINYTVD